LIIAGTCTNKGTWNFNVRIIDDSTNDTLTLTLRVK